jgi:hypothetical protein
MGAREMNRSRFLDLLEDGLSVEVDPSHWKKET